MDRAGPPEPALVEDHEVAMPQHRGELAVEPKRVRSRSLAGTAGERDQHLPVVPSRRRDPLHVQADRAANRA